MDCKELFKVDSTSEAKVPKCRSLERTQIFHLRSPDVVSECKPKKKQSLLFAKCQDKCQDIVCETSNILDLSHVTPVCLVG